MLFSERVLPIEVDPSATGIEWVESDCPLCGGDRWTPLIEAPDNDDPQEGLWFLVVRCDDCGLAFTNPRPSEECIGRFYPDDYKPHHKEAEPANEGPSRLQRLLRRVGVRPPLRKVLPLHGAGRLLDFGCGGGTYLLRMQRQGWRVTGLDFSLPTVQRLRTQYGLDVHEGTLPHPALEPAGFDVVTMWHSLEHVHRPLEVLRAAREVLAPGGKLVVALQNIASLPFRWFRTAWFALDLPRHLTHFDPRTLTMMVTKAGFRPDPVRQLRSSAWMRSSAKLAVRRSPRPARLARLLQGRFLSNLASWYCHLLGRSDAMLITATRE